MAGERLTRLTGVGSLIVSARNYYPRPKAEAKAEGRMDQEGRPKAGVNNTSGVPTLWFGYRILFRPARKEKNTNPVGYRRPKAGNRNKSRL
jgi:hypothetical protein